MFKRWKKKVETHAIAALIVVPLVLCVTAFLGLAGYFGLREVLSPALSALVTAAAGIVLIAFVLVITRLSSRSTGTRARPEPLDAGREFEAFLREQADPVLTQWVREHPEKAALTTLLLGVAAGYSQTVRQVLLDTWLRQAEMEAQRRRDRGDC